MAGKRKVLVIVVLAVASIVLTIPFFADKNRENNEVSNNTEQRAELIKINDSITLIDDAGESTYYLVCGTKKAVMIDTGNGYDDVMAAAGEITDLPVEVINTHGHCDHIGGNVFCKEVWISEQDFSLCEQQQQYVSSGSFNSHESCTMQTLSKGQIFDLGGIELEVIELPGHTPGSIGLLDSKDRILFSGDAVNPYIWLQLSESLSVTQFRKNIACAMEQYGDAFDYHLCGHTKELIPKQQIYDLLKGCDEIIEGKTDKDADYPWFGGVGKAHIYGDGNGKQICYDDDNI